MSDSVAYLPITLGSVGGRRGHLVNRSIAVRMNLLPLAETGEMGPTASIPTIWNGFEDNIGTNGCRRDLAPL
ncbi:hypothetical protein AX774_g6211 [Zancudomyces culisetae]|uniref:Uncharacterized protein n=1 Tax=Zancudomyces culisetae TaxID=1213189 RepID=A0A1R1PH79_ZANCU|nr:hypothetical protein AX774_g6211 [Zancudomyces culisetae]|eukprot:OMH80355.1 hypothetical protein AX774_g6211 [Zancudomyces culisetae]